MKNTKGQFQKGHKLGVRFGSGQSVGGKEKYIKSSEKQKGRKLTEEHSYSRMDSIISWYLFKNIIWH